MGASTSICNQKARKNKQKFIQSVRSLLILKNDSIYQEGKLLRKTQFVSLSEGIGPGNKSVVIKKYTLQAGQIPDLQTINKLIETINSWNHPNLVRYHLADYRTSHQELIIISEYVKFNFDKIIEKTQKSSQIKQYLRDLLKLLEFLYQKKITDVNLKASNIMVTKGEIIKIRDYIANDYLDSLVYNRNYLFQSMGENLNVFRRNQDLMEILNVLKIFYKVNSCVQIDAYISKNLIDFINVLNNASKLKPCDIPFTKILSHSFFTEEDAEINNRVSILIDEDAKSESLNKPNRPSNFFISTTYKYSNEEEIIEQPRDFAEVFFQEVIKANVRKTDPENRLKKTINELQKLDGKTKVNTMTDSPSTKPSEPIDIERLALEQIDQDAEKLMQKMLEQWNS